MNRQHSIGYIPPTPFRDDSDVFVLPGSTSTVRPLADMSSEGESALPEGIARELELIQSLRAELRNRHSEIMSQLERLLDTEPHSASALPAGSGRRLSAPAQPVRSAEQAAVASPSDPETDASVLAAVGLPASAAPAATSAACDVDGADRNESDRLALLKAQLADRIRAMQSRGTSANPAGSPDRSASVRESEAEQGKVR